MGKRRPWLVLAVLLVPMGALADDHNVDLCFAPLSTMSGSRTWGVHIAATLMAKEKKGKATLEDAFDHKRWSAVADLSGYSGRDGTDPNRFAFLVGPKYVHDFRTKKNQKHKNVNAFVQVLVGAVHTRDGAGTTLKTAGNVTSPTVGAGLGLDVLFSTEKDRTWGFRVQVDALKPLDGSQKDWAIGRLSGGAIYRFHTDK